MCKDMIQSLILFISSCWIYKAWTRTERSRGLEVLLPMVETLALAGLCRQHHHGLLHVLRLSCNNILGLRLLHHHHMLLGLSSDDVLRLRLGSYDCVLWLLLGLSGDNVDRLHCGLLGLSSDDGAGHGTGGEDLRLLLAGDDGTRTGGGAGDRDGGGEWGRDWGGDGYWGGDGVWDWGWDGVRDRGGDWDRDGGGNWDRNGDGVWLRGRCPGGVVGDMSRHAL
jgi:hypothetical protein